MKGVVIRSDYSPNNLLQILQKDDGDVVIRTYIRDEHRKDIEIATSQGGTQLNHSLEVRQHLIAIIDLLSDGTERDDVVRIMKDR